MKIVHIADVHISKKTNENLANSFEILKSEIQLLMCSETVVLAVAGDVFDVKGRVEPDDIVLFYKLLEIPCPIIFIAGNHDINPNSLSCPNMISALCQKIDRKNIYIAEIPKIIQIEDVYFYCFPFDTVEIIPRDPNHEKTVAIVHETIQGSCGPLSGKPANLYSGYDITLLGDIHKRQYMTPRMAYPGSFTQVKIDEGIDHGYLIWDTENWESKYVPIKQKYLWIQIRAKNNKLLTPFIELDDQVVRRAKLYFEGCDSEFIENTINSAKLLYGEVEWEDCTKIRDIAVPSAEIPEQELDFIEIIEKALPSKENLEEICNMFRNYLPNFSYKNRATFKVMYMGWDNLFCYGKRNYMNFEDLGLITGIFAKNASGKSSFCNILQLGIFRSINSKKTSAYNYVNYNENKGNVDIQLLSGNEEILLRLRIETTQHKKVTPQIYVRNNNISAPTMNENRRLSESLFGTAANFENINYMNGESGIFRISESSFRQFLLKLFGLEKIDDAVSVVKKEITLLKKEQDTAAGRIGALSEMFQKDLCSDIEQLDKKLEILNQEAEKHAQEIAALNEQLGTMIEDHFGMLSIKVPRYINSREIPADFNISKLVYLKSYIPPEINPESQTSSANYEFLPEFPYNYAISETAELEECTQEYFLEPEYEEKFRNESIEFTESEEIELLNLEKENYSNLIDPKILEKLAEPKYHNISGWPCNNFIDHPGPEIDRIPEPIDPYPGKIYEEVKKPILDLQKPNFTPNPEIENYNLHGTIEYNPDFETAAEIPKPTVGGRRPYDIRYERAVGEPKSETFKYEHLFEGGCLLLAPLVNPDPCGKFQNLCDFTNLDADSEVPLPTREFERPPSEPAKPDESKLLSPEILKVLKLRPFVKLLEPKIKLSQECSSCCHNKNFFSKISKIDQKSLELHEKTTSEIAAYQEYLENMENYNKFLKFKARQIMEYQRKKKEYEIIKCEFQKYKEYLQKKQTYENYLKYKKEQEQFDQLEKYLLWETAQKYKKEQILLESRKKEHEKYMAQKMRHEEYLAAVAIYYEQSLKYERFLAKKEYLRHKQLYDISNANYTIYRRQLLLHENCMMRKLYEDQMRTYEKRYYEASSLQNKYKRKNILTSKRLEYNKYKQYLNNLTARKNKEIVSNRAHHRAIFNLGYVKVIQNKLSATCKNELKTTKELAEQHLQEKLIEISRLQDIRKRSVEVAADVKGTQEKISKLEKKKNIHSQFAEIFNSNGKTMNEILKHFMNSIIEEMNSRFEEYGIQLKVQITTSASDKIEIKVSSGANYVALNFASRGQKFMIDLVFRITVIKSNRTPCLRLLLLDESMDCLDMGNREKIYKLIANSGIPVILISHSQDIQSKIDKYIQISQKECYSQIQYGREKEFNVRDFQMYENSDEMAIGKSQLPPSEKRDLPADFKAIQGSMSILCEVCNKELKGGEKSIARHVTSKDHVNKKKK